MVGSVDDLVPALEAAAAHEVAYGCYAARLREQCQAVLRYAQPVILLTARCSITGSSNILILVGRIDSVVV